MKNKQALRLLIITNIISGFAQGISMLAIPWYFTYHLNAESTFGIVLMTVTLTTVFWSLYAGSLIDRYSRKKIFLMINIFGAVILNIVAFYGFQTGAVPMALVILVFAATIYIYNIHYPSLYAFGQEISERENYGKMNSYFEIQGQATNMAGGAAGALLLNGTENKMLNIIGIRIHLPFDVAPWSLQEIFLLDGMTYLVAIILISFIRYTPIVDLNTHTGNVFKRIAMGFAYLKKHTSIFIFGTASYAVFVILLVEVHLLLPWYVNNHLQSGADVYASSEIYYTIGALAAGFWIRSIFKRTNSVMAIVILMLLTTLGLFLCAFTQNVWVFFIFSALIGLSNAGIRVLRITHIFNHIPNNMIGRTGSVFQVFNILSRALFIGIFSIPFFAEGSNVTWAYFIGGLFILLAIMPLLFYYKSLKG